jgi:hypothetical protein
MKRSAFLSRSECGKQQDCNLAMQPTMKAASPTPDAMPAQAQPCWHHQLHVRVLYQGCIIVMCRLCSSPLDLGPAAVHPCQSNSTLAAKQAETHKPRHARVRMHATVQNAVVAVALLAGKPVMFTGEMVFPWMFEDFAALQPYKAAADLLAAKQDWPQLYRPDVLAKNQVGATTPQCSMLAVCSFQRLAQFLLCALSSCTGQTFLPGPRCDTPSHNASMFGCVQLPTSGAAAAVVQARHMCVYFACTCMVCSCKAPLCTSVRADLVNHRTCPAAFTPVCAFAGTTSSRILRGGHVCGFQAGARF